LMLSHIVRAKLPDFEANSVTGELNQICFGMLQRGDYELASRMLEFASKLRGNISEKTRDMVLLNLANAHKLLGDSDSCDKLLAKRDWSNVAPEFCICRDALSGKVERVVSAMLKPSFKEYFTEAHCQEWPVFFHVRDDERFKEAFKKIFGQDFLPRSRKMNSLAEIVGGLGAKKMVFEFGHTSLNQPKQIQEA
jgi:hypothetical protein